MKVFIKYTYNNCMSIARMLESSISGPMLMNLGFGPVCAGIFLTSD